MEMNKGVRRMKTFRRLILYATVLITASCATPRHPITGPDYEAGRQYAREFAKEDGSRLSCASYPTAIDALMSAKKYTGALRSEGKSESFIEGFIYGYQVGYGYYFRAYCGN